MTSSAREIATRAHRSATERMLLLAGLPGSETRSGDGWTAVRTGVDSNDFNGVISDADAVLPDELIADLATWATADDRPGSWLLSTPVAAVTTALVRLGARPERTGNWCGADLTDLVLDSARPPGLRIDQVHGDADLADWLDLAQACEWLGTDDRAPRSRVYREIDLVCGPLRNWVARTDGEPVGFASSMVSDGVVDLCDLGVLDTFRRRGIGRAIALHRLAAAAAGGARYAVSAPSQDGWQLFRALGFTLAPVVPDVCFYLEPTLSSGLGNGTGAS